jgi:hypothetical protein
MILLSTAAYAEIVLNCRGTQISFGPTRANNVTEEVSDFGFIIDLEKKEVRWTTRFVGVGTLPITTIGDTQIRFGDKGWNSANTTFSPRPLPDAETHYIEYGTLDRVTGVLEYLSETTYDKPAYRGRNIKAGDVFGDQ